MSCDRKFRHILDLSMEEKEEFVNSFDQVLTDCDGVLWDALNPPTEKTGLALRTLVDRGKLVTYLSNNSVREDDNYRKLFKGIGFDMDKINLIHPTIAIIKYLKKVNFSGTIYYMGCTQMRKALEDAGYDLVDGPDDKFDTFPTFLRAIYDKKSIQAVIIDVDLNMNAAKLIRASFYLKNPQCLFIAGATDKYLPITNEIKIFGPGAFFRMLEDFCGRKANILGKPGDELGDLIKSEYSTEDPKRTLLIGDMLEQDISFGHKCGFQTMLVLSGGTKKDQLFTTDDENLLPDYYADSIGDFVEFFDLMN